MLTGISDRNIAGAGSRRLPLKLRHWWVQIFAFAAAAAFPTRARPSRSPPLARAPGKLRQYSYLRGFA